MHSLFQILSQNSSLKERLMFNKVVSVFKAYTNLAPPYLKQLFICSNTRSTSRFITLSKLWLDSSSCDWTAQVVTGQFRLWLLWLDSSGCDCCDCSDCTVQVVTVVTGQFRLWLLWLLWLDSSGCDCFCDWTVQDVTKQKKFQANAYLFWHGHTICKFSGKSPSSSHKTTLKQQLNG